MSTTTERVKLSVKGLKADMESGLKRPEIAAKYGLNVAQINLAFKQAGIKGKAKAKPAFELINDEA